MTWLNNCLRQGEQLFDITAQFDHLLFWWVLSGFQEIKLVIASICLSRWQFIILEYAILAVYNTWITILEQGSVTEKSIGNHPIGDLSEREKEILRLVATGASNKEIASRLYISVNTVKVHLRNIFAKIGVSSRTEAAMTAVNMGLTSGPSAVNSLVVNLEKDSNTDLPVVGSDREFTPAPAEKQSGRSIMSIVIGILLLVLIAVTVYILFNQQNATSLQTNQTSTDGLPRWEQLTDLPEPRYSFAASANEDEIYVIGGMTASGVTGEVLRYNLLTDGWTQTVEKPTPVSEVSSVVIGGEIYVPGGKLESGEISDQLEIYDIDNNTWQIGAALPLPLSAYSLATIDGQVYLFGGWDGVRYRDEVFIYNPQEDVWTAGPAMPTARASSGAAVSGRKIYIIGGFDGEAYLTTNEVFSPDRLLSGGDAWLQGPELPEGRAGMGVSSVADIIYVVGGMVNQSSQYPAIAFFSNSGEWQAIQEPPMTIGSNPGLIAQGVYIYALGGQSEDLISTANLRYQAVYTFTLPIIRK